MAAGEINGRPDEDLRLLLKNDQRNFLVRNNGDQVKISDLDQKLIILYFPSSLNEEQQEVSKFYADQLTEIYNELAAVSKHDLEIIIISDAKNEDSFNVAFSGTPFLAVPFSDQTMVRERLVEALGVVETPHIEFLGKDGKVSKLNGVDIVLNYGAKGYPFTEERINEIEEEKKAAKDNQTLRSLLVSESRDFLIRNDGTEVPVSELEGKMVGLYFTISSFRSCHRFLPVLKETYNKLKERGESFEVVFISVDQEDEDDEERFEADFKDMPWLAIPFREKKTRSNLDNHFEMQSIPTLVILGTDGKTLNSNVTHYINMHGADAYPFSPEKISQLDEIEKLKHESQTLESLLVSNELDFVLRKDGTKVRVSELVGKTILFYFSRLICYPCTQFTPKLAEVYNELKAKYDDFEVIFVSLDHDQKSFEEYYSKMPWLVLPYDDDRETYLRCMLKSVGRLPHLVVVGPNGRTQLKQAVELVIFFGSNAYPFDENKVTEMNSKLEEMARNWPEKLKHKLHPKHELVRAMSSNYFCGGCKELESGWVFKCDDGCYYSLDPKCALDQLEEDEDLNQYDEGTTKDGWHYQDLNQYDEDQFMTQGDFRMWRGLVLSVGCVML